MKQAMYKGKVMIPSSVIPMFPSTNLYAYSICILLSTFWKAKMHVISTFFLKSPLGSGANQKKIGGHSEKSCACRFFVCSAFYAKHASRAAEIAFLSSFWPMMQSFIMRSPTFSSQSFAMSGFWARISFCSFGLAVAIHCPEGPA